MIATTEKQRTTGSDAWGRDTTTDTQRFRIEASDVGREYPHYLGYQYRHGYVTFRASDVGREIAVTTDPTHPGYMFWSWV